MLFKETGWIPRHIIARDECENILGVVPLYLKRSAIQDVVHRFWQLKTVITSSYFLLSYDDFAAILMVNTFSIILGQMPTTVMVQGITQNYNLAYLLPQ